MDCSIRPHTGTCGGTRKIRTSHLFFRQFLSCSMVDKGRDQVTGVMPYIWQNARSRFP